MVDSACLQPGSHLHASIGFVDSWRVIDRQAQPHATPTPTPRLVASMIPPQARALLSRALDRVYQLPSRRVRAAGLWRPWRPARFEGVEIKIHRQNQAVWAMA